MACPNHIVYEVKTKFVKRKYILNKTASVIDFVKPNIINEILDFLGL